MCRYSCFPTVAKSDRSEDPGSPWPQDVDETNQSDALCYVRSFLLLLVRHLLLVAMHLFLVANLVTTSKALAY